MTARDIQRTLMRKRFRRSKIWPNYTPRGWFECDLMEVTSGGYFVEYEIKVSLSDFKADFGKRPDDLDTRLRRFSGIVEIDHKHQRLPMPGTDVTPRRFFFVCPDGLIPKEMVPSYAGLIYIRNHHGRLKETEVVRAPDRHRQKLPQAILEHARGICYWRWHRLLQAQKP